MMFWHYFFIHSKRDSESPLEHAAHAPDVSSFTGAVDLIFLCILMEFGLILDPYLYCSETLPLPNEVITTTWCRGLAREVLQWWDSYYVFVTLEEFPKTLSAQQLFSRMFAYHARAIIIYKQKAEAQGISSDNPLCSAEQVEHWIRRFHGESINVDCDFPDDWKMINFDWTGFEYVVHLSQPHFKYSPRECLSDVSITLRLSMQ
jgi:hypothetical protein